MSTETHAPDRTAEKAKEVANRSSARRNLANTYVWTAGGGFFAESTETTDAVTETTGGSYSVKGTLSGGGMFEIGGAAGGTKIGFEASIAGGTSVTRTRAKTATKTFGLDVECTGGRDLQRYTNGETAVYDPATNQPVTTPGRVDAYRFMTFYLDVTKDNFEDFYGKVVDPIWLATSPRPPPYAKPTRPTRNHPAGASSTGSPSSAAYSTRSPLPPPPRHPWPRRCKAKASAASTTSSKASNPTSEAIPRTSPTSPT